MLDRKEQAKLGTRQDDMEVMQSAQNMLHPPGAKQSDASLKRVRGAARIYKLGCKLFLTRASLRAHSRYWSSPFTCTCCKLFCYCFSPVES